MLIYPLVQCCPFIDIVVYYWYCNAIVFLLYFSIIAHWYIIGRFILLFGIVCGDPLHYMVAIIIIGTLFLIQNLNFVSVNYLCIIAFLLRKARYYNVLFLSFFSFSRVGNI